LQLFLVLNFLAKKVLEYQQKKLAEAEKNLQYHLAKKEQLKSINQEKKEIEKEEKMINIWNKNIVKIKQEIKKIQDK
jgi:hypothetical protein